MDEFILRDYASWKLENLEILNTFKSNNNPIYERLEPVYAVLEHVYEMACDNKEIEEDLESIFEIGFNYLHSQFNVIKIYFESLFQSKCDDFESYSEMLLFLLYIFDIRTDLENHGYDSDMEILNQTETYIENMVMERRNDYDYVRNMMNTTLTKVFEAINYEYISIVDIYVEIAENLDIFLYENDDVLVIGEEI